MSAHISPSIINPLSGLPYGPAIATHPAIFPEKATIAGRLVTLRPLSVSDAPVLFEEMKDGMEARFQYLLDLPCHDLQSFTELVARKEASKDPVFYAIVNNKTQLPVGWFSLMRIDVANRACEVGNVAFGNSLQRSALSTEAQYLLAKYVFEVLGYRRYEWKCHGLNAPSKRAAIRLGFTAEGIFRNALIIRGTNRDTAWFSMIEEEWPVLKEAFELWLNPENFDEEGAQKQSLETIRKSLPNYRPVQILKD